MKRKLAVSAILSTLAATAAAQDFTLDLQNLDCEIPLDGPVNFVSDAAGTRFVTTTTGTQIPAECPGAGGGTGGVGIATDATGEIEANDPVVVSWTIPSTGSCTLTGNGATLASNLAAPTGSSTQNPTTSTEYEVTCAETTSAGSSGGFANTIVDVAGVGGAFPQCSGGVPHNATRALSMQFKIGSNAPSQPLETAASFEDIFGPWPGNMESRTIFPRMNRNNYVSLPFIPGTTGTGFRISYELAVGSTSASSVQVSVSRACHGGFVPSARECSTLMTPASDVIVTRTNCNLISGETYFLNLVYADNNNGNGGQTCGASECQWVTNIDGE